MRAAGFFALLLVACSDPAEAINSTAEEWTANWHRSGSGTITAQGCYISTDPEGIYTPGYVTEARDVELYRGWVFREGDSWTLWYRMTPENIGHRERITLDEVECESP